MKSDDVINLLDILIPNPQCELNYEKDYELLIATVLSAQSTDARVNLVTKVLFSRYDIFTLSTALKSDVEKIIYELGTYTKKADYIIKISKSLVDNYHGVVPNNRKYLESLPGVGRKTCNVVLSNLFNEPCIAVDTHVARVSKRLGLTKNTDVLKIEKDLMDFFEKDKWSRVHHQLVLFGRYTCKSKRPLCDKCPFHSICNNYLTSKRNC